LAASSVGSGVGAGAGGLGAPAAAPARDLDHLPRRELARVRDLVVLREDVEFVAVAQVLLRDLRQRVVALHGVAEERRAQLLLRVGFDLVHEFLGEVARRLELQRVLERLLRRRLVAVLQWEMASMVSFCACARPGRAQLRLGGGTGFGGSGGGANRRGRRRRRRGLGGSGVAHPAASSTTTNSEDRGARRRHESLCHVMSQELAWSIGRHPAATLKT
jgi:hypothetical protein